VSNYEFCDFITGITSILTQIPDKIGCRGEGAASLRVVSGGKEYLSLSWAFGKVCTCGGRQSYRNAGLCMILVGFEATIPVSKRRRYHIS